MQRSPERGFPDYGTYTTTIIYTHAGPVGNMYTQKSAVTLKKKLKTKIPKQTGTPFDSNLG